MAFKFSDEELSRLRSYEAQRLAQKAQNAKQTLGSELGKIAQQQKPNQGFLGGLFSGIGEKVGDIIDTGKNIGKTIWGATEADARNRASERIKDQSNAMRNEIARKYGYTDYSQAVNDENASQDFWNEISASADKTIGELEKKKAHERESITNVMDIDQNKARGQAMNTIGTVLDFIPGIGGAVASGLAEGAGDYYKAREGQSVANLGDALTSREALAQGASAGVGGLAGRKLMPKMGGTVLGRTGAGAIQGALSGATAGGIMAGSPEGAIQGALQGAQGGALMGGAGALKDKSSMARANKRNIAQQMQQAQEPQVPTSVDSEIAKQAVKEAQNLGANTGLDIRYKQEAKLDKINSSRAQDLLSQYPTISKPVARQAQPQKYVLKLADAGIVKPEEVSGIAKRITGADGKVSKMTRSAVATAGRVKTDDLFGEGSMFEQLANRAGLKDSDRKAFTDQVGAFFNQLGSRAGETLDGMDDAEELFRISKDLRAESAQYSGKGGTYHLPTREDLAKAKVLNSLASEVEDRIYAKSDLSSIKTPENIAELKALSPNNKKWADYVDKNIANAKSIGEIRSAVAPFVNMQKVIDEGELNSITAGGRGGNLFGALASGHPIKQGLEIVANATAGSNTAKQAKYALRTKQKEALEAKMGAGDASAGKGVNLSVPELLARASELNKTKDVRPEQQIDTSDWRLHGKMNTAKDLVNALAGNVPQMGNRLANRSIAHGIANDERNAELEQQAQALTNDYVQNYELPAQQAMAQMQEPVSNPLDEQIAQLSNAMGNALSAGDFGAYTQLAKMLGEAQDIQAMQAKMASAGAGGGMSSEAQKQMAKLGSAENAINELEALYKNAGGAQGRIGGGLAELGANLGLNSEVSGYNAMAEGLINQIAGAVGKTDALNNEGEVKRALALIPKITDTAEEAQIKLDSLRKMLQTNTQTYTDIYGA